MGGSVNRIGWVDYARCISILLVVMMHSTLGVEAAFGGPGWLHPFVLFADSFRIPLFFLVSGLFVARVLNVPLIEFLDRRVLHYAYFYILWLNVQFLFKSHSFSAHLSPEEVFQAYLAAYIQPFGTLWFIYVLPIFFVLARICRSLPPWFVISIAVCASLNTPETGVVVIDASFQYFVYFVLGHYLANQILQIADTAKKQKFKTLCIILIWFPVNAILVGYSDHSTIEMISGILGTMSVILLCALFGASTSNIGLGSLFSWIGRHSLVIYLGFFIPMAATRTVLLRAEMISDIGAASLVTFCAAVSGPAILYFFVRLAGIGGFLFERPEWARLTPSRAVWTASGN